MNFIKKPLTLCCAIVLLNSTFLEAQVSDSIIGMIDTYLSSEKDSLAEKLNVIMYANEALSVDEARAMGRRLSEDNREKAMHDMVMADVYYYKGNLDSSSYYYEQMLLKALEAKDTVMARIGASNLASTYDEKGNIAKSLQFRKYYFKKLKNDPETDGTFFYNVGNSYLKLGQIDSATYYLKKTAEIDRKNGNEVGLLYDLIAVIELNFRGEKYEEALQVCDECIEKARQLNKLNLLSNCYYLMADVLRKLGQNDKALVAIDEAERIDKERGSSSRMSIIHRIKGKILDGKDDDKAERFFKSSMNYARDRNDLSAEASALLSLVNFHMTNGNYNESETYLNQVEKLILERDFGRIESEYLDAAYLLYKNRVDYKAANEILEKKVEMLTADNNELFSSQAESIDQSYDLFQAESANERLAFEKELNELASRRKNNIYFAIAIMLLLTSLLWYFAFQNQKNKMAIAETVAKEKELRSSNILLKKEMDNLRSQMNPHFLFNSLNSINDYVMHEDPKVASIYLTKFSRLMRTILNHSKKDLVQLSEEIKAIQLYMELEIIRFKNKFVFEVSIDPALDTENILIPPMLIQPFLENAVKHGMKSLGHKGRITLDVYQLDNRLFINVKDNGIGRKASGLMNQSKELKHKSYGMEITSDRINLLNSIYDVDASITYKDHVNPSGTEVILSLLPELGKNNEWKRLKQSS